MKKIGIMGGTFNPIHNGHIEIAKAAYDQYKLDEVWFMPNHLPGYKSDKDVISGLHRYNMTNLAIKDYDHFKVSDIEIRREGKTYSYETFTILKNDNPDVRFYFIMGADSLFYFDKWVHPEIIIKYTDILVASRDDNGIEEINNKILELENIYGEGHFYVIQCPNIDCSSSKLRQYIYDIYENESNIKIKEYINKYIPSDVYRYIIDNKLYC